MKLVKEGVSVLFFPEGTRTTDGAMAAFKVCHAGSTPTCLGSAFLFLTIVKRILFRSIHYSQFIKQICISVETSEIYVNNSCSLSFKFQN